MMTRLASVVAAAAPAAEDARVSLKWWRWPLPIADGAPA
jgi:hypothetical protein